VRFTFEYLSFSALNFSLARFGKYNYLKASEAQIFVSSPLTGCAPIIVPNTTHNFFVLMTRGGCTIKQKAFYAEKAKAKVVLIVNDIIQDESTLIFNDDPQGLFNYDFIYYS